MPDDLILQSEQQNVVWAIYGELSDYLKAVNHLILKTRISFGLPPLASSPEVNEAVLAAEAWMEVLYCFVPLSRLHKCWLTAMREHESWYPLSVSEICKVYRETTPRGPGSSPPEPRVGCPRCSDTSLEVVPDNSMRVCHHEPL